MVQRMKCPIISSIIPFGWEWAINIR
jgi:hypothetical protein